MSNNPEDKSPFQEHKYSRLVQLENEKVYPLDFKLSRYGFNPCLCIPGLVYDVAGMDKSLVEMFKEEKNKTDEHVRLYISPTPFYIQAMFIDMQYPIRHNRDLIGFKDSTEHEAFRNMLRSLVVSNPKTSTIWRFRIVQSSIPDPLDQSKKIIVDQIQPYDMTNVYWFGSGSNMQIRRSQINGEEKRIN